ncbi:hypothetical protein DOE76_16485 [Leifsonia sp. ku-ls]|nr:hypothetical protein DOE76_16485 [Leifsonia sp. ku-ls]
MSDLKTRPVIHEEVDGLDESPVGVPSPHTASESAGDYVLPTVLPKRVAPLAVLSLVLAVVFPFAGVPLAYHVVRKLQHDGGRGVSVAQAAIVIGYLNILLIALVSVNIAVALLL